MSDNGYDNIELNELINDLKGVGNKNATVKDTKITFQYSNPNSIRSTKQIGNNLHNDFMLTTLKNEVERISHSDLSKNCKSNQIKNTSQYHINQIEVDSLQKELSMVKKELAILKRSNSLVNHPIFGENLSQNRGISQNYNKTETEIISSLYPNSQVVNDENVKFENKPKILRNNFSSVSNISYQLPNTNNFQYQSLTRLNTPSSYSARRENLEKLRSDSNKYITQKCISDYSGKYYDETEDCTLQPIGKGIQTLTGSLSSMNKSEPYFDDKVPEESNRHKPSYFDFMKSVKLMKSSWLKLDASREECKKILSKKEIGSFIVRIQSEYKVRISGGMLFELILKVNNQPMHNSFFDDNYEYFTLKEFIESTVKGIKLIGHAIEPMFPTLDSFVLQHLEIPLGLPCCLKLPALSNSEECYQGNKNYLRPRLSLPFNIIGKKLSGSLTSLSSMKSHVTVTTYAQPTQAKLSAELLFLGKVTVDRLNGLNAIRHAVDKILINGYQPKHCIEINAYFDSLAGISIIDNERILFFKKFLSSNCIIYCEVDPLHRGLNSDDLYAKGIKNAKIFGIVYQKRKILIKEHKVLVLAESNPSVPMEIILKFVKNHLIKQNII